MKKTDKFPEDVVAEMKQWLEEDKHNQKLMCPFSTWTKERPCKSVCLTLFPDLLVFRVEGIEIVWDCPCKAYGARKVRKVAKEIVKKGGEYVVQCETD